MWTYIGIFLLALFLRVYRLGELPYGLNVDEAGMGYDAFSLAHWGMDRYFKIRPVYFINYGSGQSVLYGYCCAVLMKFFDPSVVLIRTPAVCFGMIVWLFGTLTVRKLLGKRIAVLGSFLLAVCPCFILHSRIGMDCFLFSGMSVLSLYILLCAAESAGKKSCLLYTAAGASLGVTLYTYALSWLAVPFFLIFFLAYLWYLKRIDWKQILCIGVPLGILAAPLILEVLINTFDLPEIMTGYFTIPKLMVYRETELSLNNAINNIPSLVKCYFFNDDLAYNSLPTFFSLYLISIPFCMAGIWEVCVDTVNSFRERCWNPKVLLFLWFLAQTGMGLLIDGPNVNKMNAVYFVLLFFTVLGLRKAYCKIREQRNRRIYMLCISAVYLFSFVSFGKYYFTEYKEDTFPLPLFWGTYAEVLDEWEDVIGERTVYTECPYAYYALGEKLSPLEFKLVEKGTKGRDGIWFDLPEEPDENGFYIIFKRHGYAGRLEEAGFTRQESGWYTLLYKE